MRETGENVVSVWWASGYEKANYWRENVALRLIKTVYPERFYWNEFQICLPPVGFMVVILAGGLTGSL